ncbi:hypothetical protein F9L33_04785 [Amylibacter sp. SFDW26]|uniref:head-tail connector protein n=1 Tax=Amylibacter sp. SFDW26 TaxID=2652722 RepID=UPI0012627148|nr:hypothetical protein [Amylibacter sp. SFDW26]KAB7616081.1 hypothetical protein F9L33_04785 [Amylibacter sp. SFDW26]
MILTETISVSSDVLPVDAFKAHLQMGTGFADSDLQDEVLEIYLRAAIAAVEARSGRVLLRKQYVWSLTRWRDAARQVLPVRPVVGVTELRMINGSGEGNAADVDSYRFVPDDICPAVEATGMLLPPVPVGGSVDLMFEAGFGAEWAEVPADLAQAVLIVAANAYENRTGTSEAMPIAALSLIEPYRALRVSRGV